MTDSDSAFIAGELLASDRGDNWRIAAWIGLVIVLFIPLWLGALLLADRVVSALPVPWDVREVPLGLGAVLWALLLVLSVAMIGRIFGLAEGWQPGLRSAIGYTVGTAALIGIVWSVRTAAAPDAGFEVDHAMPQLLIPLAVFLIATGEAGKAQARTSGASAAWSMVVIVSCLLAAITVVLTTSSLDTGSLLAIALASAYGTSSIVHLLSSRSRSP